jgi:hypothetical protein
MYSDAVLWRPDQFKCVLQIVQNDKPVFTSLHRADTKVIGSDSENRYLPARKIEMKHCLESLRRHFVLGLTLQSKEGECEANTDA